MSQYALPIQLAPIFAEDNFVLSECNRKAHQWIMKWPEWPAHALIVYGPSGAGKTHLGHIWANKSAATIPDTLTTDIKGATFIENIERANERTLLHLINISKENNYPLLMTSSVAPKSLPFTLPDLTSRLLALPTTSIEAPDDELLAAVLRKQFSDRQLKVEDEVIAYVLPRIERSFAHIKNTVERLDNEAIREKKSITVPFAKRVLGY